MGYARAIYGARAPELDFAATRQMVRLPYLSHNKTKVATYVGFTRNLSQSKKADLNIEMGSNLPRSYYCKVETRYALPVARETLHRLAWHINNQFDGKTIMKAIYGLNYGPITLSHRRCDRWMEGPLAYVQNIGKQPTLASQGLHQASFIAPKPNHLFKMEKGHGLRWWFPCLTSQPTIGKWPESSWQSQICYQSQVQQWSVEGHGQPNCSLDVQLLNKSSINNKYLFVFMHLMQTFLQGQRYSTLISSDCKADFMWIISIEVRRSCKLYSVGCRKSRILLVVGNCTRWTRPQMLLNPLHHCLVPQIMNTPIYF